MKTGSDHRNCMRRLARIEGQVRGISRMVEEQRYCIDILTQLQAVRAALQAVSREILEKHLTNCVADSMRSNDENEVSRKIDEVMGILKRMSK